MVAHVAPEAFNGGPIARHEQSAVHMADGYARASGRVGVVVATSGPGATNLVTGLATAMLDSTPLVAITGQVGSALLGTDAFQEVDITGITLPVTKHNYLVTRAEDVVPAIREAFALARSGRPGPCWWTSPRMPSRAGRRWTGKGPSPGATCATCRPPSIQPRWPRPWSSSARPSGPSSSPGMASSCPAPGPKCWPSPSGGHPLRHSPCWVWAPCPPPIPSASA
jgi:hypothetical protein